MVDVPVLELLRQWPIMAYWLRRLYGGYNTLDTVIKDVGGQSSPVTSYVNRSRT